MKITPLDIQQHQFNKKGKRYEAAEVDAFLEMVRLEMEELNRICMTQAQEIKKQEAELHELRSQEKLLKEAILTTQKASETIIKNAGKEAEVILAHAKIKADQVHDQARQDVQKLHDDISDLRRQRIQLEANFKAMLNSQIKMLEASIDDSRETDSEADKIKIMGK